ncbi:LacI family DNA-binding transcriptional regulator [[Actinomadura] parvosata]|uniref:LacI family DNA-binding transcriptional regulator n=1 Tax=[Actinomadura] parvosata TaxID=1955412 RepID=UPI00406D12D9
MVTIHDVAARAGVSPATVSRFLRGQRVRSYEAIQAATDELGYWPSAAAQSLKSGRTHTIGVVVPDITNPYFAAVVKGMESVTRTEPYRILLANSDESSEQEDDVLADMVRRVDGIILAPATERDETPLHVHDADVPLVFVDRDLAGGERFDAVLVEGAQRPPAHALPAVAARAAHRHLRRQQPHDAGRAEGAARDADRHPRPDQPDRLRRPRHRSAAQASLL